MYRHFAALILLLPLACSDSGAADAPVCPRSIGDTELFGPVTSDNLTGVLKKCMPVEQYLWLVFADDGPYFTVNFSAETTQSAADCFQERLLQLGLKVIEADTTGGETSSGDGTTN